MVRVFEWVKIKDSNSVYEVCVINYKESTVSLKPITKSLKELGYLSIRFEDLHKLEILGNPKDNEALRLLYG